MIRKAFKTCAAGLAAGLGLLGGALPAMGQTPPTTGVPGDWPNLGAFNNRQGRNVNPFGYNSGATNLRYTLTSTPGEYFSLDLDNTDLQVNGFTVGGPYDDPINTALGSVVVGPTTYPNAPLSYTSVSSVAAWPVPTVAENAAASTSPPEIRTRQTDGTRPLASAPRQAEYFVAGTPTPAAQYPSYNFAYCVPSARGGDGTTAATGTASYFQWKFVPLQGNSRTFAIYAYIPEGTTFTSPQSGGAARFLYPQRYFAYEIRFGPDRDNNGIPDNRIVDILDTEKSGGGYVRLGVTGSESSTYLPSDGVTPIQVRLYNTVPRDSMVPSLESSTDKLLLPNAPAPDGAGETALAAQHLVYADAARVTPHTGTYTASPSTATLTGNTTNPSLTGTTLDGGNEDSGADWNLTLARTNVAYNFTGTTVTTSADEGRTVNGTLSLGTDGVVINVQANPNKWDLSAPTTPFEKWRYSLSQSQTGTTTQDDNSPGSTNSGFSGATANPNHIGSSYLTSPVDATGNSSVTYKPDLADGDYDIYAYIPGDYAAGTTIEQYATALNYTIYQGTTAVYSGTIDESKAQGWFHLGGNGRFANTQTALPNEPLSVVFFSKDNNATADAAANRKAFADALQFVGQANSGFNSTPVHASVKIAGLPGDADGNTKVVLVADENGVIHCLDEVGRGDGTTTEYWSYPSTIPNGSTTYADPNLVEGIDGTYNASLGIANRPTAVMPTGFDLSTAAIAHVPVATANGNTVYEDRLYVGTTNGRVYCINMTGRGDYSIANRTVGTTQRRWTFPDDYDPSNPTAPSGTDTVGAFRGSVVYGYPTTTVNLNPTVYVASAQGRVYSLDAIGNSTTTQTTIRARFPAAGSRTFRRFP